MLGFYQLEYEIVSTNGGQLRLSGTNSAFDTTNIPSATTGVKRVALQNNGGSDLVFNNNSSFVGEINNVSLKKIYHPVFCVWKNSTDGLPPIIEVVPTVVDETNQFSINAIVDKDYFDNTPDQAELNGVIGLYITGYSEGIIQGAGNMLFMEVTETNSPPGHVSYDPDTGEFLQENIDLTYAAPKDSITKLLTGLMHKEGMLMNIDHTNKEVEFFSYSYYKIQVNNGVFYDWTHYLQEYVNPDFNTQYGQQYAITNRLGLSNPYSGNTVDIILGNQSSQSKYKEFKENYLKDFRDVKKVDNVNISGSVDYVEYEVSGLSLVEHEGDLPSLKNFDWDKNDYGNLIDLPYIKNVNFTIIPDGVSWWYNLIDTAVRAKPTFLIPAEVASNLDLRKPIYVGQLGGFYILEELEGYQDSSTPVRAKLIKIPDVDATTLVLDDTDPSIKIIGSSWRPSSMELVPIVITDVYIMMTSTNFNNYVPTSATMYAEKLTGSGGTTTGTVLSSSIVLNQQGNYLQDITIIGASDPITSSEEGYYNVYVEDQDGLRSNEVELYLGDV